MNHWIKPIRCSKCTVEFCILMPRNSWHFKSAKKKQKLTLLLGVPLLTFFQVLPVGMTQWFPKLTTCRWQSPRATSKCQAPHLGFPTTQTLHLSRLEHVSPLPQLTCHNIFSRKNESLSCAWFWAPEFCLCIWCVSGLIFKPSFDSIRSPPCCSLMSHL